MTKAKLAKTKSNEPRAIATPPASASRRSLKASASKFFTPPKPGKIDKIIAMMRRPKGATINDLTKATSWQAHSVRGAISGTLRKKQGLNVISEKSGDIRLYRIADKVG